MSRKYDPDEWLISDLHICDYMCRVVQKQPYRHDNFTVYVGVIRKHKISGNVAL